MILIAALVSLYLAMVFSAYARDAYDAERWKTDPGYCRYGAPFGEVLVWWWRSRSRKVRKPRRKPVLPQWPTNRWPGS